MNNEIDYAVIGKRIKHARKNKSLKQHHLAEHLGLSDSYVSQIESGKIAVSLKRLAQISNFLDVDMGMLLTASNKSSNNYMIGELSDILLECSPEEKKRVVGAIKAFLNK